MTSRRASPARASVVLLALVLPLVAAACITVSRQDEIAMGRDHEARLDDELPLIREEAILRPVSEAGLALAAHPPPPEKFRTRDGES